jgi:pyruvate kinase
MLRAGMNVARLNLSHGTLEEHKLRLERIREAAESLGTQVAIMIDTRGIEIRTGRISTETV